MRRFLMFMVPLSLVVTMFAASDSDAVSKNKVMQDFKANYTQAAGRKLQSMEYVGKPRSFMHPEGLVKVPYKAYQVKFVDLFEACGLKVEYIFEVWYRKDATYVQNVVFDHKFLNTPPPPEALTDDQIQALVRGAWSKGNGSFVSRITQLKVDKQTGTWEFCNPKWDLEFTVQILAGDESDTEHDLYECQGLGLVTKRDDKLEILTNECKDPKTGNRVQCYYKTHCKNLGKKSAVAPITWGEVAKKLFEKGICEATSGGRSGRSDCEVSTIKAIKEGTYDEKTKLKSFRVAFEVGYTEKNQVRKSGDPWTYESKYRCVMEAPLFFNTAYTDKWGFKNEVSWCAKADGACELEYEDWSLVSVCQCLGPEPYCKALNAMKVERSKNR